MDTGNNCVPKLSQKELLAIKDQLEAEKLVINKLEQYETELEDPELKNIVGEMAKTHKGHYNILVKNLNC